MLLQSGLSQLRHYGDERKVVPKLLQQHAHPHLRRAAAKLRLVPHANPAARAASSTFYDILELPSDVGLCDIKRAYRLLARTCHPDVSPAPDAATRFIQIREAYETLSDPRRRAAYDHAVAMGRLHAASFGEIMPCCQDLQACPWNRRWEQQLLVLNRRSTMQAWKRDSWAARVRMQTWAS
ncbi:hypothetical protein L7F22_032925 [Adiantum nelumboides]|nr:hypothetical protein [Adiantum nelumboides]